MAQVRGRDITLRIGDGGSPENFTTIARGTAHTITIGNSEVEINTKDSLGWRDLFPEGAIKNVAVSMSGVFIVSADQARLKAVALDSRPAANFQVVDGSGDRLVGEFMVPSYESTGETEGVATFSASFASNGVVTNEADA